MMTNRFPGHCRMCKTRIDVGEGFVEKAGAQWVTYCRSDVPGNATVESPGIALSMMDSGRVRVAVRGFLGEKFDVFRRVMAENGGGYDAPAKINWTTLQALGSLQRALATEGFTVTADESVNGAIRTMQEERARALDNAANQIDMIESRTGWKFYGFQRTGVQFLATRQGALLADDMGLGKTCQILGAIQPHVGTVVVAPGSVKYTWETEAKRMRPDITVKVLSGRKNEFAWPAAGCVTVVNYDILSSWVKGDLPPAPEGTVIVADEAQKLLNRDNARTKAFTKLAAAVRARKGRVWLASATPLTGTNLWAFYGLLEIADIAVEAFGGPGGFIRTFGGSKDSWGGWSWQATDLDAGADAMSGVMLRRMKRDLPGMPGKIRVDVGVDIKVNPEFRKIVKSLEDRAEKMGVDLETLISDGVRGGIPDFTEFSRLRQLLATLKIPALMEMLDDMEDDETTGPVVVFSDHRGPIDALADRPDWVTITGDTPMRDRALIAEDFQRGVYKGVGITIDAGGTGLTLTRSHRVIFVDRSFVPTENEQAEDRCLRIGSTETLMVQNLISRHPIDERLAQILAEKTRLFNGVVNSATRNLTDTADMPVIPSEIAPYVPPPPPPPAPERVRRGPAGDTETWAANGLRTLTANDPDLGGNLNDIGFNRLDAEFGHSLARQLDQGLTDAQWNAAVKMVTKYRRQIGPRP